jgi:putative copper resistance protein D
LFKALRRLEILACAGTIAGLGVWLLLEAAEVGDGWSSVFDPAILSGLAFETWLGRVWCVQVCLALCQCGLTISDRHLSAAVAIVGPSALALSFGFAGHGSSLQGTWGEILPVLLGVHILSAGAWVGGLPGVWLSLRNDQAFHVREELIQTVNRFSTMAQISVLVAVASGLCSLRLIAGEWPLDLSTPYRQLLTAKIVLVAVMLALAALNRFVLTPRLVTDPQVATMWLRRSVALEVALSITVLALVAQIGTMMPMQ